MEQVLEFVNTTGKTVVITEIVRLGTPESRSQDWPPSETITLLPAETITLLPGERIAIGSAWQIRWIECQDDEGYFSSLWRALKGDDPSDTDDETP